MSDRKPLTWAERVYREGYAQGERLGYSSGLAEGMIESISEGLAKRLGEVLQEVMAESLLHCLEKGRAAGLRQALLEVTRLRFGEESEEAFHELTESIESPNALEKMLESAMWSKDAEDWIGRASSLIDTENAKEEAARTSAPIS